MGLTTREISWRIEAINKRVGREIDFELAIHGISPKGSKGNNTPEVSATKEQEDAITQSFNRMKMLKKQGSNGRKINDSN